jgi:hypothetical protein
MNLSRCAVVLMLSCAPVAGSAGQAPAVNLDAKILQDFTSRIGAYVTMQKKLERESPPPKSTKDPAQIKAAQEALAARIREARANARQGDIFTPEIAALFRKLMSPEVKGPDAKATKQTVRDEAPAAITLKVNASYPENQPLPTVPPNLLAALPRLPESLEFRFVNNDLILRDVHANLIVDYIPKALQ